jgi:ATP-dependent helicase HrpA
MLIEAGRSGGLSELLIIVSALALQDPRDRPHEAQQAADAKHRQHWDDRSDFVSLVNLWRFYEEHRQALTQGRLRRFCRDNFLSFVRMREWRDNHRQLHLICKEMGLKESTDAADYDSIHRALLSGLLGNIGHRQEDNVYLGPRGRKHYLFPGSSQFRKKPAWIMSAELVETTRLFARTVAQIDSNWIEPLASHLVKQLHYQPHFSRSRGQVMVYEDVQLYGLTIVSKRSVAFGPIEPATAREMFIQSGLVDQQLNSRAGFFKANRRLRREIDELESRARKRDILVDEGAIYQFYDRLLPADVCSEVELNEWLKVAEKQQPGLLTMSRSDLMRQDTSLSEQEFPRELNVGDARLKLNYRFDPEHQDDGVNVNVPISVLQQVSEAQLDWLIPGMLREKCKALIKSLPKSRRKNFVPVPEYVEKVLVDLEFDGRPLTEVLAERLFRLSGVRIAVEDFEHTDIDRHLKINIKVVDAANKVLAAGRDIHQLRNDLAEVAELEFQDRASHDIEQHGLTDWTFGQLPQEVHFKQAGISVTAYTAIVDEGDSVAIRVFPHRAEATRHHEQGLVRLLMIRLPEQSRYLRKNIPDFDRFSLYFATRGSRETLLNDVVEATFRIHFLEDKPEIRDQEAFERRLPERQSLFETMNRMANLLAAILARVFEIERDLPKADSDLTRYAIEDIRAQLDELIGENFLQNTPLSWLRHYPRFLSGIEYRLDKLRGNLDRDREFTAQLQDYREKMHAAGIDRSSDVHWLLQEYRISLFAQALGTSVPVSAKRIDKVWDKWSEQARRVS